MVGLKQQAEDVTFTLQTVPGPSRNIYLKKKDYFYVLIVHGCSETVLENKDFI